MRVASDCCCPGTVAYHVFLKDILWGLHSELEDPIVLTHAANVIGFGGLPAPPGVLAEPEQFGSETVGPRFSGYDRERAVAYARAWTEAGGRKRNPAYPDFGENDCTNFVSQVVAAGGVTVKGSGACGSSDTDLEWYANRASWWCPRSFSWSASWVNVYHFWHYQTQNTSNATYRLYTSSQQDQLRADAQPGDIIQLQWVKGGAKWHSMVVTRKDGGEIYLTYHSGPGGLDIVDKPLGSVPYQKVHYWLLQF